MKFITAIIFALLALFSVNANAISHASFAASTAATARVSANANTVKVGHTSNAESAKDGTEIHSDKEARFKFRVRLLAFIVIWVIALFVNKVAQDFSDERYLATLSPEKAAFRVMFCSPRVQKRFYMKNMSV